MSNVVNLQEERDKRCPKRLLAAAAKFLQYHEQDIDYSQFNYLEQWEANNERECARVHFGTAPPE